MLKEWNELSYYQCAPIEGGGGGGSWKLKTIYIIKNNVFNSLNSNHTSDPLLPDPPDDDFLIVSSWLRAWLGRIKYKTKATITQIPVSKMKLVSSLFDANGPSNLCTIKIKF